MYLMVALAPALLLVKLAFTIAIPHFGCALLRDHPSLDQPAG
jgi:hypothetical protein